MLGKIFDLFVIVTLGFGLTYFLTPIIIRLTQKIGLVCRPHDRGIHRKVMPVAGGLGFGISFLIIVIFYFLRHFDFDMSHQLIVLFFGTLAVMGLGLIDDFKNLNPWQKLVGLIIISSIMYFFDFKITLLTNPLGKALELGHFSYVFTVGWYLLLMNAFNLIDGMDGLSAGIAAIVSLILAITGWRYGNPYVVFLSIGLFSSCLAFLKYNFYPAKIFMGDTGALLLGFLIASISTIGLGEFKAIAAMTLLIPLASMIIPLLDTSIAIFRRARNRKNIFKADKEHLHHKMLSLGHSQRVVAIIAYFITFLFGLVSLGFSFADKRLFFVTLAALLALMGVILYWIYNHDFHK